MHETNGVVFHERSLGQGETNYAAIIRSQKNVIMMSSMHTHPGMHINREDRKPHVIDDCNHGKGSVDLLDACIEDFTFVHRLHLKHMQGYS